MAMNGHAWIPPFGCLHAMSSLSHSSFSILRCCLLLLLDRHTLFHTSTLRTALHCVSVCVCCYCIVVVSLTCRLSIERIRLPHNLVSSHCSAQERLQLSN